MSDVSRTGEPDSIFSAMSVEKKSVVGRNVNAVVNITLRFGLHQMIYGRKSQAKRMEVECGVQTVLTMKHGKKELCCTGPAMWIISQFEKGRVLSYPTIGS